MESSEDILSADKLLFTVDLVDYIIIKTRPNFGNKTINILERVDRIRNFTYNRFNKTIKKALSIIDINKDRSVYNDFENMMDERRVNKESFTEYANNYRERHLVDGFHAKSFLMYCDRVANMAGYFLSYGVDDASDVAVELIMQAFPEGVMYHETWNELTNVAETLVVLGGDYYRPNMSSESSSESDVSENEDNSCSSVNMDVDASFPEDMSHRGLHIASDILRKTSERINASNGSPRTDVVPISKSRFELREMNYQSTDSAGSSFLSSIKYSSNDTNPEEVDILNSGS